MQPYRTQTSARRTAPLVATALVTLIIASTSLSAQVSPPTPQSVAPDYTPPVTNTYPGQPAYHYVPTKAGTWDFYLTLGYASYDTSSFGNTSIYDPFLGINRAGNLKMDFDDSFTYGFGFDYNINDRLAVGAEFSFSQPDYDASFSTTMSDGEGGTTPVTYRISGDADIYTGNVFAQYSFTNKSKFTPFLRGSVGFAWIDTGIPSGPTEYYWWWDWWWGGNYVVGVTPTKNDTVLTLGATAGVRYDFGNGGYLAAAYDASWLDTPHDWTMAQRVSLSVGWNY